MRRGCARGDAGKCYSEPPQKGGTAVGSHGVQRIRFLVPVRAIAVIETSAAAIQSASSCTIELDRSTMSDVHDEVAVVLVGNLAQMTAGATALLDAIHSTPESSIYLNCSTHYRSTGAPSAANVQSDFYFMPNFVGPLSTVQIYLHDSQVGCVVGRGGCHIMEIQRMTSTRIKMSQRNVFLPGTQKRIITITGPAQGIQAAQLLIMERASPAPDARGKGGAKEVQDDCRRDCD